jgi:hypothetical protein
MKKGTAGTNRYNIGDRFVHNISKKMLTVEAVMLWHEEWVYCLSIRSANRIIVVENVIIGEYSKIN